MTFTLVIRPNNTTSCDSFHHFLLTDAEKEKILTVVTKPTGRSVEENKRIIK